MSRNLVPKNYLVIVDTFISHWGVANTNVVGSPIVLSNNYTLANLQTDRAELAIRILKLSATQLAVTNATTAVQIRASALKQRMVQFNQTVRSLYPAAIYSQKLPHVPSMRDSSSKWKQTLEKMVTRWQLINTEAAPLTLSGYTLAQFQADLLTLVALWATAAEQKRAVTLALTARDQLWQTIVPSLVGYRQMIPGRFDAGSWVISSMPKLY